MNKISIAPTAKLDFTDVARKAIQAAEALQKAIDDRAELFRSQEIENPIAYGTHENFAAAITAVKECLDKIDKITRRALSNDEQRELETATDRLSRVYDKVGEQRIKTFLAVAENTQSIDIIDSIIQAAQDFETFLKGELGHSWKNVEAFPQAAPINEKLSSAIRDANTHLIRDKRTREFVMDDPISSETREAVLDMIVLLDEAAVAQAKRFINGVKAARIEYAHALQKDAENGFVYPAEEEQAGITPTQTRQSGRLTMGSVPSTMDHVPEAWLITRPNVSSAKSPQRGTVPNAGKGSKPLAREGPGK